LITLQNLTKTFHLNGISKTVLQNANMVFPSGKSVALLGRNGAGKSTLLRLIAGTLDPTVGRVRRAGSVSWPVGFAGSFHGDLTGAQNTRFIARIYGVDGDELVDFTASFADLGAHFHLPFRTYSSGMKARLAFGTSMGIAFDTYLVDEVTAVGDAAFRSKSNDLFHARMQTAGSVVVSHSMGLVRDLCDAAAVLEAGRLIYYDDVSAAIDHHERNLLG
jgi:capsular polysaccharide transport system ATP-binding protein